MGIRRHRHCHDAIGPRARRVIFVVDVRIGAVRGSSKLWVIFVDEQTPTAINEPLIRAVPQAMNLNRPKLLYSWNSSEGSGRVRVVGIIDPRDPVVPVTANAGHVAFLVFHRHDIVTVVGIGVFDIETVRITAARRNDSA